MAVYYYDVRGNWRCEGGRREVFGGAERWRRWHEQGHRHGNDQTWRRELEERLEQIMVTLKLQFDYAAVNQRLLKLEEGFDQFMRDQQKKQEANEAWQWSAELRMVQTCNLLQGCHKRCPCEEVAKQVDGLCKTSMKLDRRLENVEKELPQMAKDTTVNLHKTNENSENMVLQMVKEMSASFGEVLQNFKKMTAEMVKETNVSFDRRLDNVDKVRLKMANEAQFSVDAKANVLQETRLTYSGGHDLHGASWSRLDRREKDVDEAEDDKMQDDAAGTENPHKPTLYKHELKTNPHKSTDYKHGAKPDADKPADCKHELMPDPYKPTGYKHEVKPDPHTPTDYKHGVKPDPDKPADYKYEARPSPWQPRSTARSR
eukprot:TRINITY_DN23092_c0_g1_i1.p1 TRINITY_DN23092_c0_g1~~TRINITY_DN23092_c0_g1_i1.p1  ORF type:complete len:373 (+),score=87.48 TRINITY_DN23092_c0_g1_i1:63-1181(+)